MTLRIATETLPEFVRRRQPVLTIEVANRFGLGQHQANLQLSALARDGILTRYIADTLDHGQSFVWSLPISAPDGKDA